MFICQGLKDKSFLSAIIYKNIFFNYLGRMVEIKQLNYLMNYLLNDTSLLSREYYLVHHPSNTSLLLYNVSLFRQNLFAFRFL